MAQGDSYSSWFLTENLKERCTRPNFAIADSAPLPRSAQNHSFRAKKPILGSRGYPLKNSRGTYLDGRFERRGTYIVRGFWAKGWLRIVFKLILPLQTHCAYLEVLKIIPSGRTQNIFFHVLVRNLTMRRDTGWKKGQKIDFVNCGERRLKISF